METVAISPKVTWIFIFVIFYWAYCVFWGIRGSQQAHRATDYFLAGRRLPFWVFVLAATATSFSGWTFLGHPGQTFRDGLQYAYASFYAITIPLAGTLFLKRQWLLGRRYGFVTPGEMLAWYYNSEVIRLLVVLVALVFSVPYLGLQVRAAGFLFNVLTDGLVGVEFGMWVLAIVVISYVASGGLKTVAYVDVLQGVLLALGIVIIGVATLYFIGGWERFLAGLAALSKVDFQRTPDDYSHYVAIPGVIQFVADGQEGTRASGGPWTGMMILSYLFALMGIQASPAFSMLAFASRDPAPFAFQQVWASAFVIGLILMLFTVIQGIGGHLLGGDPSLLFQHPELVKPLIAGEIGGATLLLSQGGQETLVLRLINLLADSAPWLVGLLAVCALAAMESTAACYMATAGGLLTRDVFLRFILPGASDRTQKFVGRMAVVGVVVLALLVATTSSDALVLLGGLAVSYGAQMWPALLGLCYWPFLTRRGVALGLVAGLTAVTLTESVGVYWLGVSAWGRWPLTIHSAGWGILCNLGVAVLVSLLDRDRNERKREVHAFLARYATVSRRRWLPWAWIAVLAWFGLFAGPGAVLGNTLFGDPNLPEEWLLGLPSIWWWQWLGWISGVSMLWLLAYHLGLGRAPTEVVEPLAREQAARRSKAVPDAATER